MNDLLREIAALLPFDGSLVVKVLADEMSDGFCLIRTAMGPGVDVAVVHDGSDCGRGEAEGYARVLSGAPATLRLLAGVLAKWGEAVEDDEAIDGGDAVDWLAAFTVDVRAALQAMVGPLAPGQAP